MVLHPDYIFLDKFLLVLIHTWNAQAQNSDLFQEDRVGLNHIGSSLFMSLECPFPENPPPRLLWVFCDHPGDMLSLSYYNGY
jgi:hypothetical protein